MRAIWCLVVVSLAIVYGESVDEIVEIPLERIPPILQASAKCIKEMNLDKDILRRYLAWQLSDSDTTRKYMYCIGNESGYIADDGSIVKNEMLEAVGSHRDRVDGVIDECNKLRSNDKYETVYRAVMCFHEKSKLEFKV